MYETPYNEDGMKKKRTPKIVNSNFIVSLVQKNNKKS
jgi:hypothetical protein